MGNSGIQIRWLNKNGDLKYFSLQALTDKQNWSGRPIEKSTKMERDEEQQRGSACISTIYLWSGKVKPLMIFRPIFLPVQQLQDKEKKYAGEGQNSHVKPVVLQDKRCFQNQNSHSIHRWGNGRSSWRQLNLQNWQNWFPLNCRCFRRWETNPIQQKKVR